MDINSATAEFAFHADTQHTSMPTVNMNTKAGIQAQNYDHQTSQRSNSDSMESLSKISTRPSQCSLSGSRKFTPVFDDFATAHSSITSGNAKSRISNRINVDLPLQNRSVSASLSQEFQIRPLKTVKRNEFSLEEAPLPPLPVALKDSFNLKELKGTNTKDAENCAFSTRNFDKIIPARLSDTNAQDPRTPISEKSNTLRSTSYTPVTNAGNKYAAKWPFSSVHNELDKSSARRYYSGKYVPKSDLLSLPQAPGRPANLDGSSPYYEQPKYQPSLFDSSPDPTVQGLIGDDQGLESFASYEENIEHYYGYDTRYGGSHEDHDLVVFSPLAPGFDDQNQSSSSKSSPNSEGSTVVHIVENYTKGDGESEMSMSCYEDGSSDDCIQLPGEIPTLTKATHGSPMICPSEESVNKFPTANYGRPTFRTSPTAGEPPNTGLPQVPAEPDRAYLHDVSPGGPPAHSSSYGDTRILLDMTQNTKAMNNVNQYSSHGPSTQQSSDNVEEPAYPAAHFRLERDISLALCRLSDDDDDASMKSFVPIQRHVEVQTSSSFESVIKSLRSDQRRISKIFKEGFYSSQGSRSPSRLQVQNDHCIRIPISHGTERAITPEISHRQVSDSSAMVAREDDGNDWETVVTGSVMFGRERSHPYGEMTFNETGSSIANFSDHKGDSSSGPILSGFASSEQAIQHPARSNDYYEKNPRCKRDTSMSIFLPRRSDFSNGGFPSNAFRTPKKMLGSITSSLSPEAPRSSHKEYARLDNVEPVTGSPYKSKIRDRDQQHLSISTAMDGDFSVPGSFAGQVSRLKPWIDGAHNQGPSRPNSYMQMIIAANNGKIPHYIGNTETRTVGSSIADESDTGSFDQQARGPAMDVYNPYVKRSENHGFKAQQHNDAEDQSASRTHTPFIRGPPGAFYKSLRSKGDTRRTAEQQEFSTPTRMPFAPRRSPRRVPSGVDESPSRKLRPLSLVADALGPIRPVVVQPRAPVEFQYRSPLAPVRSPQWRGLYSTSQLNRFNISPIKPNKAIGRLNGDTVTSTTSWEVHQGAPCLTAWKHDNSSLGANTAGRKSQISSIALIMCCIFPPALALMKYGLLDQFMVWQTRGEISHFGKWHKKIAGYVFAAYAVVAIIAVIVVVVFNVARSTSGAF